MAEINYRLDANIEEDDKSCITCTHYSNRVCGLFRFDVSPLEGICDWHRHYEADAEVEDGKILVEGEVLPISRYGEPPKGVEAKKALEEWESFAPDQFKNILRSTKNNESE